MNGYGTLLSTSLFNTKHHEYSRTEDSSGFQTMRRKKIAHKPGPNPQRGWSRIGAENTATLFAPDKVVSKSDAKVRHSL